MKTSWHERFSEALKDSKVERRDLAAHCKVSAASITGWTKGGIKMIEGDNLVKAAQIMQTTPEWIMLGEGEQQYGKEAMKFASSVAWVYRNASEDGKRLLEMALESVKASIKNPSEKKR